MRGDVTAGTLGATLAEAVTQGHCTHRRFSSSVALTPEEQEQRALYAAILEYEQDHVSAHCLPWVPWGQASAMGQGVCCPWVLWGKRS